MERVFDSKNFPGQEALAAWTEMAQREVMPKTFRAVDSDVFRGWSDEMSLGPVQVSSVAYPSIATSRTPKSIRVSDPECLQIVVPRSGPHFIEQNRRSTLVRPGELVLLGSSRPFESYAIGEAMLMQFPIALLPVSARHVDQLVTCRLPGDKGIGQLLVDYLGRVTDNHTCYTPADTPRLGTIGLDLAAAVLAHHLEREDEIPADSRQRALYTRVTSFIQDHLGDPMLSVDGIAAAHHISDRSLHRLFQAHGASVRASIREQRLERCRRDLFDPVQRHVPIRAIAARWGHLRPADFTRAFRSAYGVAPVDYRHQALQYSSAWKTSRE
ncbi:helix-turn-helix domain-containing protein (plasmid) [Streptomyces sp. NBC_01450]|uniref:helix-turn-helix domain-containing protein n=1 Tax=Streptomyces sp. NBC_01450 TaxID=2903871 RepID=UPI002E30AEE0|nr:helix-turn-helix domain-containing protein [Streptomyces sp. NBC_01450]